jgi:hypothetical protein
MFSPVHQLSCNSTGWAGMQCKSIATAGEAMASYVFMESLMFVVAVHMALLSPLCCRRGRGCVWSRACQYGAFLGIIHHPHPSLTVHAQASTQPGRL